MRAWRCVHTSDTSTLLGAASCNTLIILSPKLQELAAEEERIYAEVMEQAQELSLAARENFRLRKQQELLRVSQGMSNRGD